MSKSAHLIPRNRLKWIPSHSRLAHEYCFFLHDEASRLLVEYEKEQAHVVSFKFRNRTKERTFNRISKKEDTIAAMCALGYEAETRRVILNAITCGSPDLIRQPTLHVLSFTDASPHTPAKPH